MESSERIAVPMSSSGSRSFLNRGSEASIASIGSSSGSRSGIKMGLTSQRLAINRPVRPLDPNELILNQPSQSLYNLERTDRKGDTDPSVSSMLQRMRLERSDPDADEEYQSGDSEDSEESEWEQEITSDGNVQYVLPFAAEETEDRFRRSQEIGNSSSSLPSHVPPEAGVKESGKRLSRLVRRRESKRDRTAGGQVVLKTPGGQAFSKMKNANSHESSDNDSSTYGQIKTFEAFFEATNLDCSVASPAPPTAAVSSIRPPALSPHPEEGGQDMTEIHEVVLKFQAKLFKSQIPRFQMLLHGDNPANRGMLLENLLGIVPEPKPIQSQVSSSGKPTVIDNSVVIATLVPQGPAGQAGDKIRVGDIIRSLDGHHVTLDSVNTFLLTKLTRIQNSSTVKVKLILQRPMKVSQSKVLMPPPTDVDMSCQRKAVWEQHKSMSDQALRVLESSAVCAAIITQNSNSESATSMDLSNVLYQFPQGEQWFFFVSLTYPIINLFFQSN